MQCASAILSIVACSARQYFATLSNKRHDFRKKKTLDKKCVFRVFLQPLSETFFIIRINERDKMKNLYWYSYEATFFLSQFNET